MNCIRPGTMLLVADGVSFCCLHVFLPVGRYIYVHSAHTRFAFGHPIPCPTNRCVEIAGMRAAIGRSWDESPPRRRRGFPASFRTSCGNRARCVACTFRQKGQVGRIALSSLTMNGSGWARGRAWRFQSTRRAKEACSVYFALTPNVEQEYKAFLPLAKLLLTTADAGGGKR